MPIGEIVFDFNGGGNNDNAINLSLVGDSGQVLREFSASVIRSLKSLPSLRDVTANQDSGNRELSVRVDREKAKEYGFSANDVAQFIAIALRGMQLKDFHGQESQLPVWLRFRGSDAQSLEQLSDYKIRRPDGSQIPLLSVVNIDTRNAASVIERDSRRFRSASRPTSPMAQRPTTRANRSPACSTACSSRPATNGPSAKTSIATTTPATR